MNAKIEKIEQEMMDLICSEYAIPKDSVASDSKLMENLGLTSFDIMLLLPKLEEKFNIEFSTSSLRKIVTVRDLADSIVELLP